MTVLTSHPGKAIWTLFAVVINTIRFPFWLIYYIPSSNRPNPKWTFRQVIAVQVVKNFLYNASVVQMKTPLSLIPSSEKERFAVLPVADKSYYIGPAIVDPTIKPEDIGATWYAGSPSKGGPPVKTLICHFHGGAYVIGDGRTQDAGFAANTFLKYAGVSHVVAPQYRLSSNKNCRFPAALQDAITSYVHLLKSGIKADQIVLSGDSAGANLALSLTRYLTEHGEKLGLPKPKALLLWSPWVDPYRSRNTESFDGSPNRRTDYITGQFGVWGALEYAPSKATGIDLNHPYISFIDHPFKTDVPVYVSTGECEVLFHDNVKLVEGLKSKGTSVVQQIEDNAVHDIILVGKIVGFHKEAELSAKRAGEWLKTI